MVLLQTAQFWRGCTNSVAANGFAASAHTPACSCKIVNYHYFFKFTNQFLGFLFFLCLLRDTKSTAFSSILLGTFFSSFSIIWNLFSEIMEYTEKSLWGFLDILFHETVSFKQLYSTQIHRPIIGSFSITFRKILRRGNFIKYEKLVCFVFNLCQFHAHCVFKALESKGLSGKAHNLLIFKFIIWTQSL